MKKVIIIGSPGAGKSTFARKLRDRTGLPLYYLDLYYHRADRTTVPREEFDAKLAEIMRTERWILDGNFNRTMEWRMQNCDTVIFMDYPLEVCLSGIRSRVGVKREEMPWVEEEVDEKFRQFVEDFPKTTLPVIYELIEQYRAGREIHILHSREEAERFLEGL